MNRLRNTFRSAFCILSLLVQPPEGYAQTERVLCKEKGVFLPPPTKIGSYVAQNIGYSPAQIAVMYSNMAAFMELMQRAAPCIDPPKGFEVKAWAELCGDGSCEGIKVMTGSSGLLIREYARTAGNPKPELAAEGPSIKVWFNDIRAMLKRGVYDVDGFQEPVIEQTVAGCPVLSGGYLILTKSKKPLFIPVTQETVLQNRIREEEDALARSKVAFNKGTSYQQWLQSKDATLKSIKEGLDIVAKTNPAEAKEKWEKTKIDFAQMEADMKSRDAKEKADNLQFLEAIGKKIQEWKQQLASLSPAERKAQAKNGNGKKIVVPNPHFWDNTRKPTDIQLVIIDLYWYELDERRFPHQLIRTIRETLDIATLSAAVK